MAENQESHAEGIFGTGSYAAAMPAKKAFKAWHKPRKQYVRDIQWRAQIEALLEDGRQEGNTLRYLGLPGDDLLDLRYFHSEICAPRNIGLRFLGFNTSAGPESEGQTDLNVSFDEVRKLPAVDPNSDIIWDDFKLIGDDNSTAWHKAKNLGPYDVINLDLCDGFGKHEPGRLDETYYAAINKLLTLQAHRMDSWLFFLTTRSEKRHVHPELLARLIAKYLSNLNSCEAFKIASDDAFGITDEGTLSAAAEAPEGHLAILLVGLCKWFLGLATAHQPPWTVEVRSVIGYRVYVGAGHDDLISIALRFTPTFSPVNDPMGIANHAAVTPDEGTLAANAVREIRKRACADDILAGDPALFKRMADAMADLLVQARYDSDAYHNWLNNMAASQSA